MTNKDTYTIGIRNEFICYFKNGELHRENGPAVFLIEDKLKYLDLKDKDLYNPNNQDIQEAPQGGAVSRAKMLSFVLKHNFKNNAPSYYLEGEQYSKEIWESMMEKKRLHKELITELPQNKEQIKKLKI